MAGIYTLCTQFTDDELAELIRTNLAHPPGWVTKLGEPDCNIAFRPGDHLAELLDIPKFRMCIRYECYQALSDGYDFKASHTNSPL
jgi:hypothetical protein